MRFPLAQSLQKTTAIFFPNRDPWDKTLGFKYLDGLHVANQNVTAIQHWLSINICTCILMHSNAMTI